MRNVAQQAEKTIEGVIKVDEKEILDHLGGLVRKSRYIESIAECFGIRLVVCLALRFGQKDLGGTLEEFFFHC